ncbi:ribonuclease HII [Lactobacillus helveticus]|uniref:Ribonuclease HII n=4 Tax=Lactobacillus helveticus TaxID=1587 RepID=RNH2_LACH4|nr:ribonuclease HII [Lactobacillus helveticus]A8YV45.1 RecName: Full=Ribonuclease HII; Short=RNase HII [Lactobacillus helveticus DPC 4571]ALJ23730.1 ribonuclease HII [Lactobacillus gallinarum]ABX27133.1 ribonuclease HII [Lactobacillus helveticus DPC 4571]ALI52678.1 ribonuclease HII [Lactobacillus helveticus]ANZ55343.1 ribonuclease HII [Lactobacillus helveticus]AQY53450.1 ribonuclease HII [Lactobacillus helveticus]
MTIKEVKELLSTDVTEDQLAELEKDPRVGVQKLIISYRKKQAKLLAKKQAFLERFSYEKQFWQKGELVAGVDEVGRGPLAGPVVTAAVIIDHNFDLLEVNDSKKLSPEKRLQLYPKILSEAVSVGIGVKSAAVIDQINIYEADRQAMAQAVKALDVKPNALLVDAMNVPVDLPQIELIKGDAKSNSIAAASIVAKVFRDKLMDDYDKIYPQYGFPRNAGYGTKEHIDALKKYGPTPIHRKTFAPVSDFFK